MTMILAGCGAAVGAVLRYAITQWGGQHVRSNFPFSTLFINLTGAFLLGLLFSFKLPIFVYTLVGTGVLGGYTTFSTLNSEFLALWHNQKYVAFTIYALSSYLGGLFLVWLGCQIGG